MMPSSDLQQQTFASALRMWQATGTGHKPELSDFAHLAGQTVEPTPTAQQHQQAQQLPAPEPASPAPAGLDAALVRAQEAMRGSHTAPPARTEFDGQRPQATPGGPQGAGPGVPSDLTTQVADSLARMKAANGL